MEVGACIGVEDKLTVNFLLEAPFIVSAKRGLGSGRDKRVGERGSERNKRAANKST
jgi:hypothetical protein